MPVVKCLEIAGALLVFLKGTCLSRSIIQAFAAHHVSDTSLKGGNNAHMKHVTPLSQVSLGTTTDNHDIPRGNGPFNDLTACFVEGTRIHAARNVYSHRHGWMRQAQTLENPCGQALNAFIVVLLFLLADVQLLCHSYDNFMVNQLPPQALRQTGLTVPEMARALGIGERTACGYLAGSASSGVQGDHR